MPEISNMTVKISADTSGFTEGAQSVTKGLKKMVLQIGGAVAGFSALKKVAKIGLETSLELRQTQTALKNLTGSTKKATNIMSELQALSSKAPFDLKAFHTGTKRLLSMGVEAKNVTKWMKSLGDAIALSGGSTEDFQRAAVALSQMQASGRVASQEMNQLANASLAPWGVLERALGKSTSQLREMAKKGDLLTKDVLPKFIEQLEKDAPNGMENMSQNFLGLLHTMQSEAKVILGSLFIPLEDSLTPILKRITEKLTSFREKLQNEAEAQPIDLFITKPVTPGGPTPFQPGGTLSELAQPKPSFNEQYRKIIADFKTLGKESGEEFSAGIFGALSSAAGSKEFTEGMRQLAIDIGNAVVEIGAEINSLVDKLIEIGISVAYTINAAGEIINSFLDGVIKSTYEFSKEIYNNLVEGIKAEDLWSNFKEFSDETTRIFNNLRLKFLEWGSGIIDSFIKGVKDKWAKLKQTVIDIGNKIKGWWKTIFKMSSPSKVMMKMGENIMKGLEIGITEDLPSLQREISMLLPDNPQPSSRDVTVNVYPQQANIDSRQLMRELGRVSILSGGRV